MDSARWDRVQSLFHDVADRPAADRHTHLEVSCADDPTLVDEVLELLDEDARTSLLDSDVASLARDVVLPPDLYALGVILYELLTDDLPFASSGPAPDSHSTREPSKPSMVVAARRGVDGHQARRTRRSISRRRINSR